MGKMMAIAQREYTGRVRSRWFVIGTILTPVAILAMVWLPHLLTGPSVSRQTEISVADMTGTIYPDFAQILGSAGIKVTEVSVTATNYERARQELREKVEKTTIDACLFIPDDIYTTGRAEYYLRAIATPPKIAEVESALNTAVLKQRLILRRLSNSEVAALVQPVKVVTLQLGGEKSPTGNFLWVMIFIMILFGSILLHGMTVLRSTLEEKLSRTVEVILSSITPFELMSGKIVGASG